MRFESFLLFRSGMTATVVLEKLEIEADVALQLVIVKRLIGIRRLLLRLFWGPLSSSDAVEQLPD